MEERTIEATRVCNEAESVADIKFYKVKAAPHGGDNDDSTFLENIVSIAALL